MKDDKWRHPAITCMPPPLAVAPCILTFVAGVPTPARRALAAIWLVACPSIQTFRGAHGWGVGWGGGEERTSNTCNPSLQHNLRMVQSLPCHWSVHVQLSGDTQTPLFAHPDLQMAEEDWRTNAAQWLSTLVNYVQDMAEQLLP